MQECCRKQAQRFLEELVGLSLSDLSRACAVHAEMIVELVGEGVIAPEGREPHRWRFTGAHLHRVKVALRLQRDLGLNLAGVCPGPGVCWTKSAC
jgi:chaperone modulatory protein CbpM